jgi:two-component system LytT family response regulator
MNEKTRLSVVIIDDNKEAIVALQGYLELMPEVEIRGTATHYLKGIKLIKEQVPDLVFLDIEMPGKTGFELLEEFENKGSSRGFGVIFHTAYDKYTIQALRESAFDFLLKPPKEDELKSAIKRFCEQKLKTPKAEQKPSDERTKKMVALPTNTGLQFIPKAEIVYFECQKTNLGLRSAWAAILNDQQIIQLRQNTKASAIIQYLGDENFIQLSQTVIVSASYINAIEYKTNLCILFPPFDQTPLKISRQFLTDLKERFDVI